MYNPNRVPSCVTQAANTNAINNLIAHLLDDADICKDELKCEHMRYQNIAENIWQLINNTNVTTDSEIYAIAMKAIMTMKGTSNMIEIKIVKNLIYGIARIKCHSHNLE